MQGGLELINLNKPQRRSAAVEPNLASADDFNYYFIKSVDAILDGIPNTINNVNEHMK